VVETALDPTSLISAVRQTVESMDPDLPVSRLTPMSTYLSEGRAQARFSLVLMSVLGAVALVLTAVGVFGVISYSVSQRTREFGIRLALGEDPRNTRRSVVLGGMRLVLVSIAIGLVGSLDLRGDRAAARRCRAARLLSAGSAGNPGRPGAGAAQRMTDRVPQPFTMVTP
jgi:putative ABC transport system permease protein